MPYLNPESFDKVHKALVYAAAAGAIDAKAVELTTKALEGTASSGLRDLANELYGDDETEIDDEGVGTSVGHDGTWVQAWVWVSRAEMIEHGLIEANAEETEEETDG